MAISFHQNTSGQIQKVEENLQSEISEENSFLVDFITKYYRVIIIGFSLCILAIVGISVFNWYRSREVDNAQVKLGKLIVQGQSLDQLEELKNLVEQVPMDMKISVLLQLAVSAVNLEQFPLAAEAYGKIFEYDKAGAIGNVAGINQANVLRNLGQCKEALSIFQQLEEVISEPLRPYVYEAEGICAVNLGEYEAAIVAYKKLINELSASGSDVLFYEQKIDMLNKRKG